MLDQYFDSPFRIQTLRNGPNGPLLEDFAQKDAHRLRQFVLERGCKHATAKISMTALRLFLLFLIAEGKCAVCLDAAIPFVAHWRLSSLARELTARVAVSGRAWGLGGQLVLAEGIARCRIQSGLEIAHDNQNVIE
jgi:hypothetical protein